jgi:hypothetical protein
MARISLDPPRTLSYRLAAWFSRRRYGAAGDPAAALAHKQGFEDRRELPAASRG